MLVTKVVRFARISDAEFQKPELVREKSDKPNGNPMT